MLSAMASKLVKPLLIYTNILKFFIMILKKIASIRTYAIIAFVLFKLDAQSQDIVVASQSHYKLFMKSTTYLVQYDNPFSSFNAAMEDAMKKYWYITPWELISSAEFEKKRSEKSSSFLFLSEAMAEKREDLRFNILNVVMGSSSGNLNTMPDLGSVPLSYAFGDDEFVEEEYVYKLGAILRFVQFYIESNVKAADTDVKSIVKENGKFIRSKEIWFIQEDLDNEVNTVQKIAGVYDGKVKIVTEQEVAQAIASKNPDVLILHKVGPGDGNTGKCLKFIVSVATGIPYYYSITEISSNKPDAFLAADFKKL
jgi:hypothetical protein